MVISPRRLTFSVLGGQLQAALSHDTLATRAVVPFDAARVRELSRQLIAVLARGNRARTLTAPLLGDLRAAGEALYRVLVPDQVRLELAELPPGPLTLEIDESLVPVPWELLHDGREPLCRRFDVGRQVATQTSRRAPPARTPAEPASMWVLTSDPRGDLPEVRREGQAIVAQLDLHDGVHAHLGAQPTREQVLRGLKDHDLVHFAGHAFADPADAGRSGWTLADGQLTAGEVAALAGGRAMPLLVFANACQSSQDASWQGGDGAQVFGLANAFLVAGVRFYLGTQWEIVDSHSAAFACAFYTELSRGRAVGAAVRRAREAVIVAEGEAGLGWASYVLYGDPAAVPLRAAGRPLGPQLPTPADLLARESIRGVFGAGRRRTRSTQPPGVPLAANAGDQTPPAPMPAAPPRSRGAAIMWISLAVIAAALATIVVTLLRR
jgi:CHAT domain-containing protein